MLLAPPAIAADPAAPFVFPTYADSAQVETHCDALMRDSKRAAAALADGRGEAGVLVAMDRLAQRYEDTLGVLGFLANVHPDKALRDAAEACELRHQAFAAALYQDARVHARLERLQPADAVDAQLRDELLAAFEDGGVRLAPRERARARALVQEIGKLTQDFERRLRESDLRLAFAPSELAGVPGAVWRGAPRDATGRVLLGLDYPTLDPVLDNARSGRTRERMWRAYQARGGRENLERLALLGARRHELARLFGLPSYADFVLRRRMAGSLASVEGFLGEVKSAVGAREARDLDELRAAMAAETGRPVARLARWDVGYAIRHVTRERFDVEQASFRPHFPPQASVAMVFALAGRLFGIDFRRLEQPLWHADAQAWAVVDAAGGRVLGTLYLDLYPRADKYGHAAVWPIRQSSTRDARLPVAALVTNLDRQGLTLEELETLLHEFGHALHVLLSRTRHALQGGTSVKLDFAEAPSQMLEEWVYDARALALFGAVCPACAPVPPELLARAVASRGFAKGLRYARQHLYASYDLALHGPARRQPLALWREMEGATPLGHVPGSMFPAGFSHLAGGYGAGYYAYLWSLATAQDLYTAFAADPLSPVVGARLREQVLARGGERPPAELVERFLGRAAGNAAFFEWLER